ncbi:MAG TPA: YciI family protein [Candidatus Dormibacteraeota bacterium]|nr:YciI family protein [Candidatus Dormibacteraeota bacterium]
MHFMMIVKHAENQGRPPKELLDAMAVLTEEVAKAGTMVSNGELLPTAQAARVQIRHGKLTTTDGPFTEAKEVVGGFAIFELESIREAIANAERFMELHRKYWPGWEAELEIRPMCGPNGRQ